MTGKRRKLSGWNHPWPRSCPSTSWVPPLPQGGHLALEPDQNHTGGLEPGSWCCLAQLWSLTSVLNPIGWTQATCLYLRARRWRKGNFSSSSFSCGSWAHFLPTPDGNSPNTERRRLNAGWISKNTQKLESNSNAERNTLEGNIRKPVQTKLGLFWELTQVSTSFTTRDEHEPLHLVFLGDSCSITHRAHGKWGYRVLERAGRLF